MVGAGAGAEIFDTLEPELHKNGPAPQHWMLVPQNSFKSIYSLKIKKFTHTCCHCATISTRKFSYRYIYSQIGGGILSHQDWYWCGTSMIYKLLFLKHLIMLSESWHAISISKV
jgi:hypothetical protein